MGNKLTIFLSIFDDTEFERSEKVESKTVFESFLAKKNVTLEEVSCNWVLRCPDDSQFFNFVTV